MTYFSLPQDNNSISSLFHYLRIKKDTFCHNNLFCSLGIGIYNLWKSVVPRYIGVTSASKVPSADLIATCIFHLIKVNTYIFSLQNKRRVLFHPSKCDCCPCKTGIQPITFVLLDRPRSAGGTAARDAATVEQSSALTFQHLRQLTMNQCLKKLVASWPQRSKRCLEKMWGEFLCFKFSLSCIWSQSML